MKNQYVSKVASLGALGLALLAMSGCMGTRYLSQNISDEGNVQQQDIVFPELDKAWIKQGLFPNGNNLSKIKSGVSKDQLHQLIGSPHFSEGNYAREWDYIMKFYMPDETIKTCQYKVIFDKYYKAQEFYWSPADCPPKKPIIAPPAPIMLPPVIQRVEVPVEIPAPIKERINLGADALFEFDKSAAENVLPQGQRELVDLAQKLRQYQQLGETRVIITGHTDRKGDDSYNMNLSLKRAQTVRSYLISQGINPNNIIATGAGETQPVQQCSTALPRQQEIDCLQPNRRVTLDVTVIQ